MAIVKVDGLGESEGKVNNPVNPGRYQMQIELVDDTKVSGPTSKVPGSAMLAITASITQHETMAGRKMFLNIMLPSAAYSKQANEMNVAKLKRLLIACGKADQINNDQFDTAELQGCMFTGIVGQEKDKATGEPRSVLKDWLPAEG